MAKYQRVDSHGENEEDIGELIPSSISGRHVKSALQPYILVLTGFCVGMLTAAVCIYFGHSVVERVHRAYMNNYPILCKCVD